MREMRPLGSSKRNQWQVDETRADFIREPQPVRPVTIAAAPQDVRLDVSRTALIIVDMQNDFCHPQGWLASIGVDVTPARAPIGQLSRLTASCRKKDVPIIWLNWGNRPDLLNLGPSTLHVYDPQGRGRGLGKLGSTGAPVLELGSWSAGVLDEFENNGGDIHVAKYAMSGFWNTPLDAILRNLNVSTLMFGGVNLDQCVLCTLQDASFRGYDCVLLEDCTATTSPVYCAQAALYNIKQCFGFVASGENLAQALEELP
jgi:nicotinamidase-related amidase